VSNLATELTEAVVGSLFVAIGLAAAVGGLSARPRRELTAIWFGLFCLLYGIRLGARSALIEVVSSLRPEILQYTDAFITYAILIPAGLFTESLTGPGWHQLVRRTWQASCGYALWGVLNDLARGEPEASIALNAPIVLVSVTIQSAHVLAMARRGGWPREVFAVAVAGAIFIAIAVSETVSERRLFGRHFDLEPFAMLLFTAALGWFVFARARTQAYGFVALSRELELAREIQHSLLPQQVPHVPGLRITGTYLPMGAVAGDFYDVVLLTDERVMVLVADVSGHGVGAALVSSMVKVAFAAESERYDDPGDVLGGINRALIGKFERAYITACCAVFDPRRRAVQYAAAGHPPALLRRSDGRVERLEDGGIVLTLVPAAAYRSTAVSFAPGDRLLLFTDGLL
jgi:phosphoserine phosphatase RsbU/P